ncbi:MAG: hypothetical protein IKL10_01505 [Clostridia bacterium]|nr:hypothetical protein [Clostridia bacterium]
MKKLISLVLVLTMLFSVVSVSASASENGYVADYDRETPVIIVHGMSQNDTYLLDDNGEWAVDENGAYITGWPLKLDIMGLVKEALFPLLLSAFLKQDIGLTDAMKRGAYEGLPIIHKDNEGNYDLPIEVPCYEYPMGKMSEELREYYYNLLPLQGLVDIVGGDNVYYFGYDSFGDIIGETEKLNYYIHEVVLEQTKAEKVNLCFISLGGTIGVNYLETYPEDYEIMNKVEFVVPAIDGSDIIGDILTGNLSVIYDDKVLYEDLLVKLLGDSYLAYIINIVLRILPSWLLKDALAALAEGVVEAGVRSTSIIWALCPTDYYKEARAKWLETDEYTLIREKVDYFMNSRANFAENLSNLMATGCKVYDICCYGGGMFPLCRDWNKTNGDGIVHATSASMGSTFADVGKTLGDGYVAAGTNCSDPTHNHISPDNTVDATTGLLPCTTWYIKNQDHEKLPNNDVVLKMAFDIMTDNNMVNVYSNPEKYPQFNEGRLTNTVKEYLLSWENADKSGISAQKIEAVEKAKAEIDKQLGETIVNTAKWNEAVENFRVSLVKAGVIEDTSPGIFENALTLITKSLNQVVNSIYETLNSK